MSNLFKSKFLLGVMVVAAMFVAVGVVAPSSAAAASCSITTTLRVGSKGAQVQCLQSALGLTADGSFGPKTKAAVVAWQKNAGLTADGVFGAKSRAAWMGTASASGMTYPAGCTSSTGYSSTTGQPCTGTVMTTTYPAGCTSASGYSPTTGVSCSTGVSTTTTTGSGPVSVALSSDNPASGYIIDNQATADLAHFTFNGSGTVTSVTLQRTGISNQNTLDNVYLFQGNTRITDGYSFNNTGVLVINNLNIVVNGPTEISVRADVDSAAASTASTIGINLTGYTAGSTPVTTNLMGNSMYLGTGSPASVYLGNTGNFANSVGNVQVNAGTTQYTIWSAPIQVNTRAVWLKGADFRVTGSAPSGSLANIHLTIDGVVAGNAATMGSINGSNYAMFDFTANPVSLSTGSHTVSVLADIVGGSSYNLVVSVQQAADLVLYDSQVGVNVAVTNNSCTGTPLVCQAYSANSSGTINIAPGSASVVVDPAFQAMTNITGGSTNTPIARFMITGYGEPVKVSSLSVTPVLTGEVPNTVGGLQNLSLYFNGSQIGSSYNWTSGSHTFQLGSQMIIPAGSVSYIEVRADLQDSNSNNYTSGTVSANLNSVAGDAQGQTSNSTITFPGSTVNGTSLTIQTGLLAVSKNTSYANQSVGPNTGTVEVGSFMLQNQSTSEAVRVTSLLVGLTASNGVTTLSTGTGGITPPLTDFSSLYVSINGTKTTPIQPTGSDTFSINNLSIAPGATQEVDIYASTSATNDSSTFSTTLKVTALGASSNVSIAQNGNGTAVQGQILTLATGAVTYTGSGAPSLLTANSTAQQFVPAGNGGATNATKATFQLNATGGSATITEAKFTVNSQDVSVVVPGTPTITTATTSVTVTNTSTTSNGADFKVGDVLQIVGATSNGLATVNGSPSATSVPVAVTVAPVGNVTALRVVPATVTSVTVNGVSAPVVSGVAYLTGLNINVPNGSGGLTQDVYVSYAPVGTNGIQSGATSRIALEYFKYTSGGTTATVCTTAIATCTYALTNAVSAPTMKLVGSVPTLTVASPTSSVLTNGNTEVADITVAANAKGDITLNALPVSVSMTNAALSTTGYQANGVVVEDSSGNPVTTTNTQFSTTTTGGTSTITFGSSGYRISAGTSQTFKIFLNFTSVTNTNGAHTASASLTLGAAGGLSWTDTGGNASASTGSDEAVLGTATGGAAMTTSNQWFYTTNFPTNTTGVTPGFFYSYPTTTATVSS